MTRFFCVLIFILFLLQGVCFSKDMRATTEDGRTVVLKKDGTWKFADIPKPPLPGQEGSYQKAENSTNVFKAKGGFLIWFDPSKWSQEEKSDDPSKTTFDFKDGDLYAMVIAERFALTIDALKGAAIKNAKEVAPDTKVTFEESRTVNGKKVLCMRMEGTIDGIQFVYYGYYYAGKAGTIQLLTYTSPNLYSEYEAEMTEFLNGLVISD